MDEYDVVVVGAGPAGEVAAQRVVEGGLTAALVESELLGGECSYWACMPSKALLRGPAALTAARTVQGAAAAVTGQLDVAATFARRDGFTSHWKDDGQVQWATGAGIDVVRGHGRLAGERRVEVDHEGAARTLTARRAVVVATGSVPRLPDIPGLADARPWGSREATSSTVVPHRLAVLGAGVVGTEMATAYSAFGSQVTLLVAGPRPLAALEPFAGDAVAATLREDGVEIRTNMSVSAVRRDGDGPTTLVVDGDELTVDVLLVATGRRPTTGDIGLDTVGLTPETFHVDDTGLAHADWLYAVGDAAGRRMLTHMGKYEARICGDAIAARARGEQVEPTPWSKFAATADDAATTSVVFSDPEVATVGRTEAQATKAGIAVRAIEYEIGNVAGGSLHADGYTGRAKLVVDADRNVIVGATFVGRDVGEMLHAATIAVVGEVPLDRLWHAVPAYPTMSEVWLRLLETAGL